MNFSEKLKNLRKQADMSQEKLAEKLGVSRQAVTKWETEAGVPEVENLMAISKLFGVSIDELLFGETSKSAAHASESCVEYDIDALKHFDIKLGGAKMVILTGHDGGKLRLRLASDTLTALEDNFKFKLDDTRSRMDVDLNRKAAVTEAACKENLLIFVQVPRAFASGIELQANAGSVEVRSLQCESVELNVKTPAVLLSDVNAHVSIDCNQDMDITLETLRGRLDINQISATSKLHLPADWEFTARAKGIGTSISYEKNGKPSDPFTTPDAPNMVELNGMKSELIIAAEK